MGEFISASLHLQMRPLVHDAAGAAGTRVNLHTSVARLHELRSPGLDLRGARYPGVFFLWYVFVNHSGLPPTVQRPNV